MIVRFVQWIYRIFVHFLKTVISWILGIITFPFRAVAYLINRVLTAIWNLVDGVFRGFQQSWIGITGREDTIAPQKIETETEVLSQELSKAEINPPRSPDIKGPKKWWHKSKDRFELFVEKKWDNARLYALECVPLGFRKSLNQIYSSQPMLYGSPNFLEAEKRTHDVIVEDLLEQLREAQSKTRIEPLTEAQTKILDLTEELSELNAKLSEAEEASEEQESKLSELTVQAEEAERELTRCKTELQKSDAICRKITTELLEMTSRFEASQRQLREMQNAKIATEEERRSMREELVEVMTERDDLKRNLAILRQKVRHAKITADSPVAHPAFSPRD